MTGEVVCRHWVGTDTKGHICGAAADGAPGLCAKHLEIVKRRTATRAERRREAADRANAAWRERNARRVPAWRRQLEQAEAEYERRTASVVADRAAGGGAVHPSIVRAMRSSLSDSNVARVVELERMIAKLRADIARAVKS